MERQESMAAIVYRRARPDDYTGILQLQAANYIGNLSRDQLSEGFLSAEFTRAQIDEIARDLGITIALIEGKIGGYLCAFGNDFNHGSPVLAKMFDSYERAVFEQKPLSSYTSYCYGPVCIGREHRRQGLLRGLYEAQTRELAGRYEIGVAFVSRNNPHSLQAHVKGLGMTEAGDFEVKRQSYAILAFRLPPPQVV